jgi:hypothetical protein
VRATRRALGITAQHSRDLRHPFGVVQQRDVCRRHTTARTLGDENVAMRPRRNLREMRDREDLMR